MTRTLGMAVFVTFLAGAGLVWWAERPAPGGTAEAATSERAAGPRAGPGLGRGPDSRAERPGAAPRASSQFLRRFEAAGPISGGQSALLGQWARTDPAGFLDALPTLDLGGASGLGDSGGPPYLDALRLASEANPRHALAVGERQAGADRAWILSTALEALASEDPDAALEYLDGVETGDLRERLLASLATGFARTDLEAAVAWLSTLDQGDGAAFYPVISAVALVDLPRAIELDARAIELDYGGLDYGSIAWLRSGLEANKRQNPARIADLLASMRVKGLLADTLAWWGLTDPYGAIAWIQSQETISSLAISRMAGDLAGRDYRSAMLLADQFAPAVRAVWIESVIGSAAPYDLTGALGALEPFRGEAFFDKTFSRVLNTANRTLGPPSAAAIAGTALPASTSSMLPLVAPSPRGSIVEDEAARPGRIAATRSAEAAPAQESATIRARTDTAIREADAPGSGADALVRLAGTDPRAAMDRALALERYWLRRDAVERVASAWAERSPNAALAFVRASNELDPDARSAVRSRVLEAMARVAPGSALGYLLSPEGQNLFFFDRPAGQRLAREISIRQPYELLAASDALPKGVVRTELRDAAIPGVVERDLRFAVRQASLAAPGSDQRQWVTQIERPFARSDPEGALEWARGIEARVPGTLRTVSALIHEAHPDRTEALGLCEPAPRIDPICEEASVGHEMADDERH